MLSAIRRSILSPVPGLDRGRSGSGKSLGMGWFALPSAIFLGAFALLRMTYPGSVEHDDADLVLFSQAWCWGYSDQPPLYNWLASAAFQVFGLGVYALVVVRLLVLMAISGLLYQLARVLVPDRGLAILAAYSVLLVGPLAWNSLTYLTHTLALVACCLWALLSALKIIEDRRTRHYVSLGLACGLAALSKYNAVWFLAALGIAVLTVGPARRRFLDRRMLAAAAVAAFVVLPHGLWLLDSWESIAAGLRERAVGDPDRTVYAVRLLSGVKSLTLLVLAVAGPPTLVIAILFRGTTRTEKEGNSEPAVAQRLVGRLLLAGLTIILIQIVVLGASRVHERWLTHFAAVFPVWLVARAAPSALRNGQVRAFAVALFVVAVGYVAARAVQVAASRGTGEGWHPVKESEDALARAIAEEVGEDATIFTSQRTTAGNLRLRLPRASVNYCGYRNFAVPVSQGPVVVVWNLAEGPEPPWFCSQALNERLGPVSISRESIRKVAVTTGDPPAVAAFAVLSGQIERR